MVRETAAASLQALEESRAQGRVSPSRAAVLPLPELRGPPKPVRSNTDDSKAGIAPTSADSELNEEEKLLMEQRELQEALLRSKADALSADGVLLTRLTFHTPGMMSFLDESPHLTACRSRVESAGCTVRPSWANGALLLVPVTEEQIKEEGIDLKAHNILMHTSDEELVKDALAQLVKRKRPELKLEHFPRGKLGSVSTETNRSHLEPQTANLPKFEAPTPLTTESWGVDKPSESEDHSIGAWKQHIGLIVERTFYTFRIDKEISEASTIVHSAPADVNASSDHVNPHTWRLPGPRESC